MRTSDLSTTATLSGWKGLGQLRKMLRRGAALPTKKPFLLAGRAVVVAVCRLVTSLRVIERLRAPLHQMVLDLGDEEFDDQGHHCKDDHRPEHAIGIERALRDRDHQSHPLAGTQELADHGADQGEAETDMKAGEDPAHGRG